MEAITIKAVLVRELVAALEAALAAARAAHTAALEGAIHDDARPENAKDTRGLEQSYLARGQAQRVAELESAIAETTALALRTFGEHATTAMSALVTVDEDGTEQQFLIAPHGGGTVLSGGVQVVTPSSPLGRALVGKRIDEEVELRLPARLRRFTITAIA